MKGFSGAWNCFTGLLPNSKLPSFTSYIPHLLICY